MKNRMAARLECAAVYEALIEAQTESVDVRGH